MTQLDTQAPRKVGLAITALAVGGGAFIFGLVPFLGLLLGATAIVFGIIALVKGENKVMAIIGGSLGTLALIASMFTSITTVAALVAAPTPPQVEVSDPPPVESVAPPVEQPEQTEAPEKPASFKGGFFLVGKDIPAGTYATTVEDGHCYFAWKDGTGSGANIIRNDIVQEGPVTVTLVDGEIFENRDCGTWTAQ